MLPSRYVLLLVVLLAVQVWAKPAGDAEELEYSDDDPQHSDYNDDETQNEDDEDGNFEDDDPETLDRPPQILSESKRIRVRAGGIIRLPCLVNNTENVAVTWKKDEQFLSTDSTLMTDDRRISRLSNNTIVIVNATVSDSSNRYECSILTNPPMTITHYVLVDPPRSTESPPAQPHKSVIRVTPGKRVEVSAGESVVLGCETRIHPAPEIKWYHENKKIEADGSHITIKNINRHNGGHYQCLIEDGSQDPPISGINVIVNYAPEVEARRDVVHTGLGVKSELTCIVHAHPHAGVTWFKEGQEIQSGRGNRMRSKTNKTMHHLEIHHTTEEDFGEYKCLAANNMGQAEKTITLTGAPSQAILYGGEMTRTDMGLVLKWRLESYSPITEYKLQYRRKGEEKWHVLKPTVTNGNGNQFIVEHPIQGLQPGSYEAILLARNNFGWSQPSVPHTFTGEYILEEARDGAPGAAVTTQPLPGAVLAISLVVSSYALTSL